MQAAADCVPQVGAERRSRASARTPGVRADPEACNRAGSAWQRRVRSCVAACLVGGALTSCGGKAESGRAPGGSEGTPAESARVPRDREGTPNRSEPSGGGVPPISGMAPEETCDENPLLAKCPRPAPAATPAPPAVQPPPPSTQSASSLVAQAEAVLLDSCGDCHGGEPSPQRCGTCDGMYYVENLRRLVQSGNIVPCRWEASPLFQRIADGSMPPAGSRQNNGGMLQDEDVELVGEVVNGLCSELTDGGPEDTQRANIERWLGTDCGSCHGPAGDATGGPAPSTLDGLGDIAELITGGWLVPCDADGSALVRVLRDDSMHPPGFSGPRPGRAELTELIAFIQRPCSRR